MNSIQNDRGETVVAIGAPGSKERLKVQYPKMIESMRGQSLVSDENLYFMLNCAGLVGIEIQNMIEIFKEKNEH